MARKASLALLAPGFAVFALLLGGCAGGDDGSTFSGSASPSGTASDPAGLPVETQTPDRCGQAASPGPDGLIEGTFGAYCDGAVASTYDTAAVPDDAEAILTVSETQADTTFNLQAQGFLPDAAYTGRLHQKACGATPADAGEEELDPQDAANGGLTMDFTTDPSGNATVSSTVPWTVPDNGDGESILLYRVPADGGLGEAAGCVNLGR